MYIHMYIFNSLVLKKKKLFLFINFILKFTNIFFFATTNYEISFFYHNLIFQILFTTYFLPQLNNHFSQCTITRCADAS